MATYWLILVLYLAYLGGSFAGTDSIAQTATFPSKEEMWREIQTQRNLINQETNLRLAFEQNFLTHLNTLANMEKRINDYLLASKHKEENQEERLSSIASELASTSARLEEMNNSSNAFNSATGAVFTRWGKKNCTSSTSRLLYSGSVGGSYYSHKGGATNYLCLPENPQRLKNLPGSYAYLYGAEYDITNDFRNGIKIGDDIPCAVCESKKGSEKMMIPARIECLPGWTKQYAGYLGTGLYSHASSKEYICVDEYPEVVHSFSHTDGALVYSVKAKCGALPCPPYREGETVTCVVCTK